MDPSPPRWISRIRPWTTRRSWRTSSTFGVAGAGGFAVVPQGVHARARAPGVRWELFVAAAQLEWRYDHNDKVARNIFELGLKTFIDDPAYVLEYADFLVGTNDVANARVLHERAAGACAEAVARAVGEKKTRATRRLREFWDAFVTFEQSHGSLDAMRAAERRRHEALGEPGGGPHSAAAVVAALMSRHTFMGLRPTTLAHSQHFARHGAAVPKQEPTRARRNTWGNARNERRQRRRRSREGAAETADATRTSPRRRTRRRRRISRSCPERRRGLETFRRWRRRRRLLGRGVYASSARTRLVRVETAGREERGRVSSEPRRRCDGRHLDV